MEENINKGKLAIRGLFEQIQIKYLHFNGKIFEKDPFFNINYPEDYEKALSL
jgi:molybdopterin-guanine dinucleotide biosynthesis protein A